MEREAPTTPERDDHTLVIPDAADAPPAIEILQRAQWLRAAILGANDGLLSTTSLMLGVGAMEEGRWSMTLSGAAGAVAGAFSMAVGEYVSVSTQRDIERACRDGQTQKAQNSPLPSPGLARSPMMRAIAQTPHRRGKVQEEEVALLPNPVKAAVASGVAFLVGSVVPLLVSVAVAKYNVRVMGMVVAASVALAGFGGLGARLGGSPVRASARRVLVGGWIAMAVTFLLLKPLDRDDWKEGKE